jgi:PadR family transcriptional regulator, regulatory protein PadR
MWRVQLFGPLVVSIALFARSRKTCRVRLRSCVASRASPIVYRWGLTVHEGVTTFFPSPIDGKHQLKSPPDLLPGTLDLLVLRTLTRGPLHGYGIAQRVKDISRDVLQVGESSLYPALQRLLLDGCVKAEWGASENNRRARYYTLTAAGQRRLAAERKEFERIVGAIQLVLANA